MHKNTSGIFIILVSAPSPVSFQLQQQLHGRLTHARVKAHFMHAAFEKKNRELWARCRTLQDAAGHALAMSPCLCTLLASSDASNLNSFPPLLEFWSTN